MVSLKWDSQYEINVTKPTCHRLQQCYSSAEQEDGKPLLMQSLKELLIIKKARFPDLGLVQLDSGPDCSVELGLVQLDSGPDRSAELGLVQLDSGPDVLPWLDKVWKDLKNIKLQKVQVQSRSPRLKAMHAHTRAKSNLNSAPRRLSPRPIYGPSRSAAVTLIAAFYFTL
uniref:C2 domain-containing protein n=1 Tax=Panagrellus redivivus TaxID=6233 RepID=A0A7E4VC57_PANRE